MKLYEQIEVSRSNIKYELNSSKENMEVSILMYGNKSLGLPTVRTKVFETEPGVKGDTAARVTKSATVETGYTLRDFFIC